MKRFWLEFLTMVIDEDSVGETVGGVFLMHVGWKKDISKGFLVGILEDGVIVDALIEIFGEGTVEVVG